MNRTLLKFQFYTSTITKHTHFSTVAPPIEEQVSNLVEYPESTESLKVHDIPNKEIIRSISLSEEGFICNDIRLVCLTTKGQKNHEHLANLDLHVM